MKKTRKTNGDSFQSRNRIASVQLMVLKEKINQYPKHVQHALWEYFRVVAGFLLLVGDGCAKKLLFLMPTHERIALANHIGNMRPMSLEEQALTLQYFSGLMSERNGERKDERCAIVCLQEFIRRKPRAALRALYTPFRELAVALALTGENCHALQSQMSPVELAMVARQCPRHVKKDAEQNMKALTRFVGIVLTECSLLIGDPSFATRVLKFKTVFV